MPMAPASPCAYPGCPVLGPCAAHDRTRDTGRTERQPWRRWYYLARWVHPVWGLRAQVLQAQPLCIQCQTEGRVTVATDVDHITPHRGDPDRFWDRANLQGLCHVHHARKSGRE